EDSHERRIEPRSAETRVVEAEVGFEDVDALLDSVDAVSEEHAVGAQVFDPNYVVSPEHLREASEKAVRSFDREENIADSLGMEILLYAAGTRQIDLATRVGPKEDSEDIVFVLVGGSTDVDDAVDAVLDVEGVSPTHGIDYCDEERVRDFFGITSDEVDAVGENKLEYLVLERVALLDINK
ncbi:MAG: KEOPS complex subunit Cgi121, partial [Halobacteria archaeon]|nr:KEOPS complex subunit Cgi121 [Halobacteria archaeon]